MFTASDTNLDDLDFELRTDPKQTQTIFIDETMLREYLSSSSPSNSNYRISKPITTNKQSSAAVQLRRQLTDEGLSRQQTPPNSMGTSLSPISPSFFTRLSSNEGSPNRVNNHQRFTATSTTKQIDPVASLLKQAIAPSQLIQAVQTRLENPTRYHLEQISRQKTTNTEDLNILPRTLQREESSPDSEITSELNDDTTCASIESNSYGINISDNLEGSGSPFLSSSVPKDSLDSASRHSSSCPTTILTAKAKIGLPLTDDELKLVIRDRQKKDNHNMIERRRRFNINDRIKELGTLLPKGTDLDSKQNKGTILRASVDYIKSLQRQHENYSFVEEKCNVLTEENLLLQDRIRELERLCLSNGVSIESSHLTTANMNIQPIGEVKEEPTSASSSFNSAPTFLIAPQNSLYSKIDSFQLLDNMPNFSLVDEDSNEAATTSANPNSTYVDQLSPFTQDPFLSSTLYMGENEMDIGGVFP